MGFEEYPDHDVHNFTALSQLPDLPFVMAPLESLPVEKKKKKPCGDGLQLEPRARIGIDHEAASFSCKVISLMRIADRHFIILSQRARDPSAKQAGQWEMN